jgi:glutathione S-transferase
MRVHWALHELRLPYDTRAVQPRSAETQTAEFKKLNSRQKIPVLQDGGFVLTESAAIVAYLSDRYARTENPLIPSNQFERTRWLEWCFFIMTELDASSLYVIRRHLALKDVYGEAQLPSWRPEDTLRNSLSVSATDCRRLEAATSWGKSSVPRTFC